MRENLRKYGSRLRSSQPRPKFTCSYKEESISTYNISQPTRLLISSCQFQSVSKFSESQFNFQSVSKFSESQFKFQSVSNFLHRNARFDFCFPLSDSKDQSWADSNSYY